MYYKQKDPQFDIMFEFRNTNKFYCMKCGSYAYIRDKIPYIICRYCGYPIFNTKNEEGNKLKFMYIMKKKLKL